MEELEEAPDEGEMYKEEGMHDLNKIRWIKRPSFNLKHEDRYLLSCISFSKVLTFIFFTCRSFDVNLEFFSEVLFLKQMIAAVVR